MWRATLAGLAAHKVRFASTALAVVLGVSFVVGTLIFGDTLNRTFDDLFGQINEGIDVQITGVQPFEQAFGPPGDPPAVPDDVVARIAEVEGVAEVEPGYQGVAQLLDAQGEPIGGQGPPTLGVDAPTVPELAAGELREGHYPQQAGEVAIDVATVEAQGWAVGDTIAVAVDGPAERQRIVGTVGFGDGDSPGGVTLTLFDDATARQRYGRDGAQSVAVLAAEGVERTELRDRIAQQVGSDYDVLTGEQAAERDASQIGQFLGFLTTGLLVFAGVSLFVGSFLIFNTFAITVAQRTRELALLRAVGASRRQVLTSVLAEALLLGLVGAAVGLGLGMAVAFGLRALLDAFGFALPSGELVVAPRTVVVALVLGPVVTVLSALGPALRSTRVPPVAALRAVSAPPPPRAGFVRVLLGGLLLAGGVAALAAGLFADAGLPMVGTGAVLVLFGMAALSVLVTRPVARLLGAPVAATRGMPGTLARENSVRNPRRTASTAAALMIGLGLVTFVLIFTASFQESINGILDDVFAADLQVQPRDFVGFPDQVIAAAAQVDGVAVVSPVKSSTVGVEGATRQAVGVDPATIERVLRVDTPEGALADLDGVSVALDLNLAADLGVGVGDAVDIALRDPAATEAFTVAATYDATQLSGQVAFALDRLEEVSPELPTTTAYLLLDDRREPGDVRADLDAALAPFPSAVLSDTEELRDQVTEQTNQLLGLVFALLFLSVLIALFGITNTLGLSVLERTRELGLLRAVGMSRAQARSMVRWEAVIVALLGAVLGLAVGVFFGWIFTRALSDVGLDAFALPGWQLAAAVLFAAAAGVIAAVLPARRAARVDVLRAIAVS